MKQDTRRQANSPMVVLLSTMVLLMCYLTQLTRIRLGTIIRNIVNEHILTHSTKETHTWKHSKQTKINPCAQLSLQDGGSVKYQVGDHDKPSGSWSGTCTSNGHGQPRSRQKSGSVTLFLSYTLSLSDFCWLRTTVTCSSGCYLNDCCRLEVDHTFSYKRSDTGS